MYRTQSLVQYFPRLAFLNFIFNFILSCFFLYLKVYANEAGRKQWRHERFAYCMFLYGWSVLGLMFWLFICFYPMGSLVLRIEGNSVKLAIPPEDVQTGAVASDPRHTCLMPLHSPCARPRCCYSSGQTLGRPPRWRRSTSCSLNWCSTNRGEMKRFKQPNLNQVYKTISVIPTKLLC